MVLLLSIFPYVAFAQPADEPDFSGMTDEELIEMYNEIRRELAERGFMAEDKKVIFDNGDYQVYINGEWKIEKTWYGLCLELPIVIINNTDKNIMVQLRDSSVNGWGCDTMFSPEVPAGKKLKESLEFILDGTDVTAIEDFEDVEFKFHFFESDSWSNDMDSDPIILVAG